MFARTKVKLLPDVAAERVRMALAEVGRLDLAARIKVTTCSICGGECAGTSRLPAPVEGEDRELVNRAIQLAFYSPTARMVDRTIPRTKCTCHRMYEHPGQQSLWAGQQEGGAGDGG